MSSRFTALNRIAGALRGLSLKTKMAVALSLLFILAVNIRAVVALEYFERDRQASTMAETLNTASLLADAVDSKLKLVHSALIGVAAAVPADALHDADRAQTFLDAQPALHALFDNGLFLISLDGRLIAESPFKPDRRGRDISAREFFQTTVETRKPYISKPYESTHTPGQPALMMTAPVFGKDGTMIGLIAGSFDLLGANILADIGKAKLGKKGYAFLMQGRETMISHPDKSRIMKPVAKPGQNLLLDRAVDAGFEGSGETVTSFGATMLASYKRVPATGWILGVVIPRAEAYAPVLEARRKFFGVLVLGTLLVLFSVWWLTRRLLTPLSRLTEQVDQVTHSARERVDVGAGDEIGRLAASFNDHLAVIAERQTEILTSRDALAQSQARLDQVMDITGEGIWDWDLGSDRVRHNASMCTILGLDGGLVEHAQADFAAMLHQDDRAAVLARMQDCLTGKGPFESEHRMQRSDGTLIWVLDGGDVVERDGNGRPLRMMGRLVDITERKQAEQKLKRLNEELEARVERRTAGMKAAKEEAERANAAKSEFLSRMSHELRTPMNAILGFSQLMEYDAALSGEHQENVREILNAGYHLLGLINDVLDLAKVESGRIELSLEPVELSPVFDECLSLAGMLADERQIRITRMDMTGTVVRADRTRLKQALLNLLSNAIKYNRQGGSVRLEVSHEGRAWTRIRVTDTGPGIPSHRLAELFQPFNRLGAESSEVEGTGIGLTITRRLVEMMGGSVDVESALGVGSSFWIELPSDPASSIAQETRSELGGTPARADGRQPTVL